MKVKELIKQLLDEDLDADVVIIAEGKNNEGLVPVEIDGISDLYQRSVAKGIRIEAVCIELRSPVISLR